MSNELVALKSAISTYGDQLAPLVAGISVGSEDLYRITPTGISNGENPGAGPDVLTNYIKQVRDAIAGTPLGSVPIGHVDTWTAWVNDSNKAVVDACDWIGVDAYPYFETAEDNTIGNGKALFGRAVDQTRSHVGGKPIWITETGWPVSGKTSGRAVPSAENARAYWQAVGCPLFGTANVYWYTMQDVSSTSTPNPSFGLIGATLTTSALYDLSCQNVRSETAPAGISGGSAPSGTAAPTSTGGKPGNGAASSQTQVSQGPSSTTQGLSGSGPRSSSSSSSGSGGGGSGGGAGQPSGSPNNNANAGRSLHRGSVGAAFAAVMIAALAL